MLVEKEFQPLSVEPLFQEHTDINIDIHLIHIY